MAKNILQDIKPLTASSGRRNASADRIAPMPKREVEQYIAVEDHEEHTTIPPVSYGSSTPTPRRSRGFIWAIVVLALLVLFVAVSYAFEGATVTVTPKEKTATLDNSFTAEKDAVETGLPFEVVALSGEESKTFTGTEKRTANDKATGTVVIYNEFSTAAQPLLIETRLETKDGKIFKTDKAVKVPGYTTKGNEIVPGSIEVGIHADVPGPSYNIKASDFTILGFKGSPKYTKIYARSKTATSGGATGELYTLTAEEKTKAKSELIDALKDKLMKQAVSQIPEGFVYYPGGVVYDIDESSLSFEGESSTVTGTAKGKISIILFDQKKLTSAIAKAAVSQYDGLPVTIPELRDINMSLKTLSIDPTTAKQIPFKMEGDVHIVWDVDGSQLAEDLAGKDKNTEARGILESWKGIDTAEILIRPFWKHSLPSKSADINVTVVSSMTK